MAHRLEITINEDTLRRLDSARGFEKRASFVKRALESALTGEQPYPFEAERRAVRDAAASGATEVRVEAGSLQPPDEPVATVLGSKVRKASLPRRADTLPGNTLRVPSAFKCPIARCSFTAKSPAAKCGAHGRTVVPVS